MVEAQALIFRLNRKIDRLNTEFILWTKVINMCNALTEAERFLVKDRIQKAQQDKRYSHELRPLMVSGKFMPITSGTTESIIAYPADYFRDDSIRICVTKRGCGKKEISLTKMDGNDKNRSLTSPFWETSYSWEQIFGKESSDGLHVYNGTDCKVLGMIIDYYMLPPEIHCPSQVKPPDEYIDWNGKKHTQDSGWILDDLVDEGINLAAMMLTRDVGDIRDFQLQLSNNIQTEQISKL